MKKQKMPARKLVLRAEAITVLSSRQLTAVDGARNHPNSDESEFSGCTTVSPAPGNN